MSKASRSNEVNDLSVQWHAGLKTVGFDGFQSWGLVTLSRHMPFNGAIWAALTAPEATARVHSQIGAVHLHRVPAAVMGHFEEVRGRELGGRRAAGAVTNIRIADAKWQSARNEALRAHARRYRMMNSLSVQFAEGPSAVRQFVMLIRHGEEDRFTADEARDFRLLAPHLMQAYANQRKLFLDSPQPITRSHSPAVALVDGNGMVHDAQPRFLQMMHREWSDWPGRQLPDALLDLNGRWAGKRWTFLGAQVSAEFAPVDNLYLVTVRPRHVADVLTGREGEVAQRYASGETFRQIAGSLDLAPATVRSHLRNVFGKLQVRNKTQLAASLR